LVLGMRVPHASTLMKITSRCGDVAVAGLNEARYITIIVVDNAEHLRLSARGEVEVRAGTGRR
jgi:hypothetical protein